MIGESLVASIVASVVTWNVLSKHRSLPARISAAELCQWLSRCSTYRKPSGMPWMSDPRLPNQHIATPQPLLECGLTRTWRQHSGRQGAIGQNVLAGVDAALCLPSWSFFVLLFESSSAKRAYVYTRPVPRMALARYGGGVWVPVMFFEGNGW